MRNTNKAEEARKSLLEDSEVRRQNPQANVKILQLDLVDEKSVVTFANKVLDQESKLDVLLCNAGINLARFEESPTGHEM